MRTIAIGDIHGCRVSLETLLDEIGPGEGDTLVTLGDYVDRGPDTKGVIDRLLDLRERVELVPLRGNHEVIMLQARKSVVDREGWLSPGVGGEATLESYGAPTLDGIPFEHWWFIEKTLPYHETDSHIFVHAGLEPEFSLDRQDHFSLYWKRFHTALPHCSGKVMVCGHTSQRSGRPVNLGHSICIDTWACGFRWLTALDVGSGRYWQANERGETQEGRIEDLLESP